VVIDFTKNGYRLPTEAEWEYACRAGTTTLYYWGNSTATDTINRYAWWKLNAQEQTHPVAQKLPNAWGLYDMVGNVWEWVHYGHGGITPAYSAEPQTDPTGPSEQGRYRMLRGGGWNIATPDQMT